MSWTIAGALFFTACGGSSQTTHDEVVRGWDGEVVDTGVRSAPDTGSIQDEASDDAESPAAESTTSTASTTSEPLPDRMAFAGLTADDGVCVVLDTLLDAHFEGNEDDPSPFDGYDPSSIDLIREVDDGPFGAVWSEYQDAAEIASNDPDKPTDLRFFESEWIDDADALANEQCGFPAMSAFLAANLQSCITPISESGERGEPICTRRADPR